MEHIFVTVGTTKFDDLIGKLFQEETIKVLKNIGCRKLVVQKGASPVNLSYHPKDLDIEIFDYKSSIIEDIKKADLIIGHSGAGTVLDVLRCGKPLLVVTNDSLMDNHQRELADKLSQEGFVISCTVDQLNSALRSLDLRSIKPFPQPNLDTFPKFLEELFGTFN